MFCACSRNTNRNVATIHPAGCDAWPQMLSPLIHLKDFLADKSRLALFIFLLPLLLCLALASASVLFSSLARRRSASPSPISSPVPTPFICACRGGWGAPSLCVIYGGPIDYRPPRVWRGRLFFLFFVFLRQASKRICKRLRYQLRSRFAV